MKTLLVPLCYYPTTAIFLDDNPKILQGVKSYLADQCVPKCFTDPKEAISLINDADKKSSFVEKALVKTDNFEALEQLSSNIDIRKIHQTLYDNERFAEVTALVVDQSMPVMEGLDVCRAVKDSSVKKIMLTGEAGHDLATEAFNEGIIDHFILKSDPEMFSVLSDELARLQREHFLSLSKQIVQHAYAFSEKPLQCLFEKEFYDLFEKIISEKGIVEYYLMDAQGSFFLLDAEGKPYWLAVKTEAEMDSLAEYAEQEKGVVEVIDALKSRKGLVYFHTDHDLTTPPAEWKSFMHPAMQLKGDGVNYYYALIDESDAYEVDANEIRSFHKNLALNPY